MGLGLYSSLANGRLRYIWLLYRPYGTLWAVGMGIEFSLALMFSCQLLRQMYGLYFLTGNTLLTIFGCEFQDKNFGMHIVATAEMTKEIYDTQNI